MPSRFPMASRLLHWTMAAMVLAMLFIGVAMVGSLADYHRLVAIHRPLCILILCLGGAAATGRLGDPSASRQSRRAHRRLAPAADSAAERCALCPAAAIAYRTRLRAVRHVPRPSRRGVDARPHFPRRRVPEHGVLAPLGEGLRYRSCRRTHFIENLRPSSSRPFADRPNCHPRWLEGPVRYLSPSDA